jgi:hypothetical protein
MQPVSFVIRRRAVIFSTTSVAVMVFLLGGLFLRAQPGLDSGAPKSQFFSNPDIGKRAGSAISSACEVVDSPASQLENRSEFVNGEKFLGEHGLSLS